MRVQPFLFVTFSCYFNLIWGLNDKFVNFSQFARKMKILSPSEEAWVRTVEEVDIGQILRDLAVKQINLNVRLIWVQKVLFFFNL